MCRGANGHQIVRSFEYGIFGRRVNPAYVGSVAVELLTLL